MPLNFTTPEKTEKVWIHPQSLCRLLRLTSQPAGDILSYRCQEWAERNKFLYDSYHQIYSETPQSTVISVDFYHPHSDGLSRRDKEVRLKWPHHQFRFSLNPQYHEANKAGAFSPCCWLTVLPCLLFSVFILPFTLIKVWLNWPLLYLPQLSSKPVRKHVKWRQWLK